MTSRGPRSGYTSGAGLGCSSGPWRLGPEEGSSWVGSSPPPGIPPGDLQRTGLSWPQSSRLQHGGIAVGLAVECNTQRTCPARCFPQPGNPWRRPGSSGGAAGAGRGHLLAIKAGHSWKLSAWPAPLPGPDGACWGMETGGAATCLFRGTGAGAAEGLGDPSTGGWKEGGAHGNGQRREGAESRHGWPGPAPPYLLSNSTPLPLSIRAAGRRGAAATVGMGDGTHAERGAA